MYADEGDGDVSRTCCGVAVKMSSRGYHRH